MNTVTMMSLLEIRMETKHIDNTWTKEAPRYEIVATKLKKDIKGV